MKKILFVLITISAVALAVDLTKPYTRAEALQQQLIMMGVVLNSDNMRLDLAGNKIQAQIKVSGQETGEEISRKKALIDKLLKNLAVVSPWIAEIPVEYKLVSQNLKAPALEGANPSTASITNSL